MQRTNIYLDDEQIVALDEIARSRGVSRAKVVRDLIEAGLEGSNSSVRDALSAIDETFGALRDADLRLDRGAGERERHLDRVRST